MSVSPVVGVVVGAVVGATGRVVVVMSVCPFLSVTPHGAGWNGGHHHPDRSPASTPKSSGRFDAVSKCGGCPYHGVGVGVKSGVPHGGMRQGV